MSIITENFFGFSFSFGRKIGCILILYMVYYLRLEY